MGNRDQDQSANALEMLALAVASCDALVERLRPRSGTLTEAENTKIREAIECIYDADRHVKSVLGE